MNRNIIKKPKTENVDIKPNLHDYEEMRRSFSWDEVRKDRGWQDNPYLNMAYESIDRHTYTSIKDKIALYWEGADAEEETYTFTDLRNLTNRFANVLSDLGVKKVIGYLYSWKGYRSYI